MIIRTSINNRAQKSEFYIISEGSHDIRDWSIDAENSALTSRNKLY